MRHILTFIMTPILAIHQWIRDMRMVLNYAIDEPALGV